ncbi:MAG: hypothetical protein ACRCYP_04340 [Alphaproteobacteria bacterium]
MLKLSARKSPLSLAQATWVQAELQATSIDACIIPFTTTGDKILDKPLADVGGKGLFTFSKLPKSIVIYLPSRLRRFSNCLRRVKLEGLGIVRDSKSVVGAHVNKSEKPASLMGLSSRPRCRRVTGNLAIRSCTPSSPILLLSRLSI